MQLSKIYENHNSYQKLSDSSYQCMTATDGLGLFWQSNGIFGQQKSTCMALRLDDSSNDISRKEKKPLSYHTRT